MQFWTTIIILDMWKVPMKWIDSTFSKLYYYACWKHCIMPEYAPMLHVSYYAQSYAGIIRQGLVWLQKKYILNNKNILTIILNADSYNVM